MDKYLLGSLCTYACDSTIFVLSITHKSSMYSFNKYLPNDMFNILCCYVSLTTQNLSNGFPSSWKWIPKSISVCKPLWTLPFSETTSLLLVTHPFQPHEWSCPSSVLHVLRIYAYLALLTVLLLAWEVSLPPIQRRNTFRMCAFR